MMIKGKRRTLTVTEDTVKSKKGNKKWKNRTEICIIASCTKFAYCKNLCRRHYGQIWRYGKLLDENDDRAPIEIYRIEQAKIDVNTAKKTYAIAVGTKALMRWKEEVIKLEEELRELEKR